MDQWCIGNRGGCPVSQLAHFSVPDHQHLHTVLASDGGDFILYELPESSLADFLWRLMGYGRDICI